MSSVLPSDSENTEPSIRGVLGKTLTLHECPHELRPFMKELCDIGRTAHEMVEEDSMASVKAMTEDRDLPTPRMERVREMLRGGVGWEYDVHHEREGENVSNTHRTNGTDGTNGVNGAPVRSSDPRRRRTSTQNRAVIFANRINALALGMTKLKAFRERQDMVFKVLAGVTN